MKLLGVCGVLACLLVAACGGSSPSPTPTPTSAANATVTPRPTPAVVATIPVPLPETTVTSTPSATPTALPPVLITLTSTSKQLRPGESLDVEVNLDPMGRGISGVQLSIDYDTGVLEVVGMAPGELLGREPVTVGPIVDEATGVLQYAAARIGETSPPTQSGTFATLQLKVLETARAGDATTLTITEVKMPDETIQEIPDIVIGDGLSLEISS